MISFPFDGRVTEIKQVSAPSGGNVQIPVSDRNYSSKDLKNVFKSLFSDGISKEIENCFKVTVGTGLKVIVQPGMIMAGGTIGIEERTTTLTIPEADANNGRMDSIVFRADYNTGVRNGGLYVVKGTQLGSPYIPNPPTRTDTVYEVVLAHVFVPKGATSIPAYAVTDTRLENRLCGIMQPRPGANTTGIFDQYQAALDRFLDTVKNALDGTLAGNLQNQIGILKKLKTTNKNSLVESLNETFTKADGFQKLFENVKTYTPKLIVPNGREIGQDKSGGYAYGSYLIIGKLCFLTISIRSKITENGEYARVSLPEEVKSVSDRQTLTLGECFNLTFETAFSAQINGNQITIQSDAGQQNAYWHNTGNIGYLKISGFLILQ